MILSRDRLHCFHPRQVECLISLYPSQRVDNGNKIIKDCLFGGGKQEVHLSQTYAVTIHH